jgi:hypothetical protein
MVKLYDYNVKVDIELEAGVETVHGKAFLIKTLGIVSTATRPGDTITIHDVLGAPVSSDLKGIAASEIGHRLCRNYCWQNQDPDVRFSFELYRPVLDHQGPSFPHSASSPYLHAPSPPWIRPRC